MSQAREAFLKPSATERIFNRAFGLLVGLGLGLGHHYLLQVRGRKTGRVHSTPVNVLDLNGRLWLVAGRGRTQWVRNAEVAGEVVLRRGWRRRRFRLRPVPNSEKPEILSAYLARFKLTVQRYFPVRAVAARAEFLPFVDRYPVFELVPSDDARGSRGGETLRQLVLMAALALLPFGWMASRPSYINHRALDPAEPIYLSSYLKARGWPEPWLITEVPARLAPAPWTTRVLPARLAALYALSVIPLALVWMAVALGRRALRYLRARR